MIEDGNGGVVLVGGRSTSIGNKYDFLFHLPHSGSDAKWTEMNQKLKIGRWRHVAFLVPDNLVECS